MNYVPRFEPERNAGQRRSVRLYFASDLTHRALLASPLS